MEIILAGYNLDRELIARLTRIAKDAAAAGSAAPEASSSADSVLDPDALTPETLSAAYARISRDPRPIPELRRHAVSDVARARRSNRRIIFGFGHASVAEHAVFNFDILGLSRLAVEALEASRLGSYTEKSQRYILLDRDSVIPPEIAGGPLEASFRELLELQQSGYRRAYERLAAHLQQTQPSRWGDDAGRQELEGAAKEDARYFLGLATAGQLGATLNARTLEATVRRLAADPLAEARELGKRLYEAVAPVAPSLVRYTSPDPNRVETPEALCARLHALECGCDAAFEDCPRTRARADGEQSADPGCGSRPEDPASFAPVRLVATTADAETLLLAALLHGCVGISWEEAVGRVAKLAETAREALFVESLRRLSPHDLPLRAFELPVFTYELVTSASCFAQLKRHRMATLLPQAYRPELGVTVPPAFREVGIVEEYAEVCRHSEALYDRIRVAAPHAAAYALTNGHRRRVLFQANARELYHLARLRLDEHAQWDIRALARVMIREARARFPLMMMLAMGKDEFVRGRGAGE